ncbi:hypothetical protein HRG84_18810 [Flavisolibacter sp. BT320]|nr:hypothetical protein [Flavisolibacter longurius]
MPAFFQLFARLFCYAWTSYTGKQSGVRARGGQHPAVISFISKAILSKAKFFW